MKSILYRWVRILGRIVGRPLFRVTKWMETSATKWWDSNLIQEIRNDPNFRCGQYVQIEGVPRVYIHPEALIELGDAVVLNSSQHIMHASAHSPATLLAKQPGARIQIGSKTRIHASGICAFLSVSIGSRCLIAANCQIMDSSGHPLAADNVESRIDIVYKDALPVVIGDDVWLCEGVKVMPGVTIGKGTVVAAGSVVTKSLPPYCLAGGIPAKVIRTFS